MTNDDLVRRVRGSLYGLLVGDALGVPYEFHAPHALPPPALREMQPPPDFRRAHRGTPIGTWSDDGAHALALLDAWVAPRHPDWLATFADGLQRWREHGAYTPDGVVFDIGNTTAVAIDALRRGAAPTEAGPTDDRSNGNGSLMRVAPLAYLAAAEAAPDRAALGREAMRQSLVTHGHPVSQICCAQATLWTLDLLRGVALETAWSGAWTTVSALVDGSAERRSALERVERELDAPPTGTGYVIDCLRSARAALRGGGSYEETIQIAIGYGHDTDTTAAVAGALAGARYGEDAIPPRWRACLRGADLVESLWEALRSRWAAT